MTDTKIVVFIIKQFGWDLENTVAFYHHARKDPNLPKELRMALYDDKDEKEPGTWIIFQHPSNSSTDLNLMNLNIHNLSFFFLFSSVNAFNE